MMSEPDPTTQPDPDDPPAEDARPAEHPAEGNPTVSAGEVLSNPGSTRPVTNDQT